MKRISVRSKWKWNSIKLLGGLLVGAGVADCIIATKSMDLNQIARGLTIFSAGLTILVVLDSAITQRQTELKQQEVRQKLEHIEKLLLEIRQAQVASAIQPEQESHSQTSVD